MEITFLPINTSTCGTTPTEHLLNAGRDLRLPKRQETPHVPGRVADRVFMLRPGIRPVSLSWESRVQDVGPPETSSST